MDALQLYDRLVRGNEFKNEDLQYLYSEFCRQWKVHIHKMVIKILKDVETHCQGDARQYFHDQLMFATIEELEMFANSEEREISWGIWITKIADTLSTDLQVEVVYKVQL